MNMFSPCSLVQYATSATSSQSLQASRFLDIVKPVPRKGPVNAFYNTSKCLDVRRVRRNIPRFCCFAKLSSSGNTGSDENSDNASRTGFLSPRSELGEELSKTLKFNPEYFEEVLAKQLAQLVSEKKMDLIAAKNRLSSSVISWDMKVLKRRILDIRENEREEAVEDFVYTSMLANLADFNTSLTSGITTGDLAWLHSQDSRVDLQALLDMFPSQALPLIMPRVKAAVAALPQSSGRSSRITLSRLGLAQMYRRMVLFGYVLGQVTERYNMDKLMWSSEDEEEMLSLYDYAVDFMGQEGGEGKGARFVPLELKGVMCSLTASRVFNRHTKAVFGSMMSMAAGVKELIAGATSMEEAEHRVDAALYDGQIEGIEMSANAVCHLIMEAIAFGSLLRQAECKIDLQYGLR